MTGNQDTGKDKNLPRDTVNLGRIWRKRFLNQTHNYKNLSKSKSKRDSVLFIPKCLPSLQIFACAKYLSFCLHYSDGSDNINSVCSEIFKAEYSQLAHAVEKHITWFRFSDQFFSFTGLTKSKSRAVISRHLGVSLLQWWKTTELLIMGWTQRFPLPFRFRQRSCCSGFFKQKDNLSYSWLI